MLGAVQRYVSLRPPPPVPDFAGGFDAAVDLLAHGWLDSAANEDWRFRHAVWMDRFGPQPAADAAMFQSWLAAHTRDAGLAARLDDGVEKTLARLDPADPFASAVSHVRPPTAPLVFGRIPEFVARRQSSARGQLRQFDPQGRVIYQPRKTDYARTHFANHANGLGGRVLAEILEAAVLSADQDLAAQRPRHPRPAGRPLCPHRPARRPDLGDAPAHPGHPRLGPHDPRLCLRLHVLTGNHDYLDHARYWAWTGVPFLYLVNPTDGPCGPYATIAVLGATNWVAPVWIGQPVQWCGLVYGSALHLLTRYDHSGPWRHLARGITIAGLQMTWPTGDTERQGLLPDFFHLARQVSDGPAINPGTVGAHLPEAFGQGTLHAFHRFPNGWILHAPCAITDITETAGTLRFSPAGWGERPYHILLSGVASPPRQITAAGKPADSSHHPDQKLLVIRLQGAVQVGIASRELTRVLRSDGHFPLGLAFGSPSL